MQLSQSLLKQFAQATNDTKDTSNSTTNVRGTVVETEDGKYVQLDGSTTLTPVSEVTDAQNGDRVLVTIGGHTAVIIGNYTYPPSARTADQALKLSGEAKDDIEAFVGYFDEVQANNITTTNLEAHIAKFGYAKADQVEADYVKATNLEAEVAKFGYAKADEIEADYVKAENLKAEVADLGYVTANEVAADYVAADNLNAKVADLGYVKADEIEADYVKVDNLEALVADMEYATIEQLNAANANIEDLQTDKLSVKDAEVQYANIDFTNINQAAVTKIFSESGIIEDLIASEGKITGELVGVTIKGDLIEGNTIKADKLVVKGSDGIYYKLNFEAGTFKDGEAVPTDGLHGSVIVAKSVTAEKVAVDDLVAFGATIGGFNITDNSLYSGVKESVNNTTRGLYLDNEGQLALGDSDNYIKYYKTEDGNYKLDISLVSKIKLGGRNLIRNSTNLIFEDYYFERSLLSVTHDGLGNVTLSGWALNATHDGLGNVTIDGITASIDDSGNIIIT